MEFVKSLVFITLFCALIMECSMATSNDSCYLQSHPISLQTILDKYDTTNMIFTIDSTFDINFDGTNDYIFKYRYYDASSGCLGFLSDIFLSYNGAFVKDTLLENLCNLKIDIQNKRLSSLYFDRSLNGYAEVFTWDEASYQKDYSISYEPTNSQQFIIKIFDSTGKFIFTQLIQDVTSGTELVEIFLQNK